MSLRRPRCADFSHLRPYSDKAIMNISLALRQPELTVDETLVQQQMLEQSDRAEILPACHWNPHEPAGSPIL